MKTVKDDPTEEEVFTYFDSLSNWGRWGQDDERGTLNFVTPEITAAAGELVRDGITVSCAWDMAPAPETLDRSMITHGEELTDPAAPYAHRMSAEELAGIRGDSRFNTSVERLTIMFHGHGVTHLDAPCHAFWDGQMYNGRSSKLVTAADGGTFNAVTAAGDGIITRGVFFDVADHVEPGVGVRPSDLEEAERRHGVTVRSGDAIVLRTGVSRDRHAGRAVTPGRGWHPASLPWLHEREVSLIASDAPTDMVPPAYKGLYGPVHAIGLVRMGLWLLDNCDLERLASATEEIGRSEFMFDVLPLRIAGGTGSPVNPVAVF